MDKEEQRDKLEAVYKELQIHDPKCVKLKCPICKGYGMVQGRLIGPKASGRNIGKCYYCGGSGVARSLKHV